jgi:type I restriction-modification system DNA methylase subunit
MGKRKSATDKSATSNGNGANSGLETKLCLTADKMHNHLDAAKYKHVVLGLSFLKYFSVSFEEIQCPCHGYFEIGLHEELGNAVENGFEIASSQAIFSRYYQTLFLNLFTSKALRL